MPPVPCTKLMASAKKDHPHAPPPKSREDEADRVVKIAPGPEKKLPAEIWELVFLDVDPSQLLRVRETCRYWRSVVDGSSALLDKLTVHFPSGILMDQHYQPEHLRPSTRAAWRSGGAQTKLVCVNTWWPTFGQKLTHLDMEFAEVSLATLLDMLRCTPNLKNFWSGPITHGSAVAAGDVAFRLDKMESLRVQKTPGTVVEKLAKICPRVKSFHVNYLDSTRAEDTKIFRSIRTLQRSLEEVVLVGLASKIVSDLCKLKQLKLKRVSLHMTFDGDCLLEFCRLQPDLEFFDVVVLGTHEELCEIGQSCPKLKSIDAAIWQNEGAVPAFLNTMSKLERLRLSAMKDMMDIDEEEDFLDPDVAIDVDIDLLVNFEGIKNEHLRELDLYCMRPDVTTLQTYVKQSPKLANLHLDRCTFAGFADMMAVLQAVESLEHVKLSELNIEHHGPFKLSSHKSMNSVKRLEIHKSNLSTDEVEYLLWLCPMLEELTLQTQHEFVINHKLGSLKKLDLRRGVCSPRSIFSIVFYCRSLQELLVSAGSLTADCRDVLEKQFGSNLSLIVG